MCGGVHRNDSMHLTQGTERRYGMTATLAKSLGLEAILWLARVQRKRTGSLLLLHASGGRLPAQWWLERAHWPIESIISGVEAAINSEVQSPHG